MSHYLALTSGQPLRLRPAPNRRRHTDLWRFLCLLLGFCLGWILRSHLIG